MVARFVEDMILNQWRKPRNLGTAAASYMSGEKMITYRTWGTQLYAIQPTRLVSWLVCVRVRVSMQIRYTVSFDEFNSKGKA